MGYDGTFGVGVSARTHGTAAHRPGETYAREPVVQPVGQLPVVAEKNNGLGDLIGLAVTMTRGCQVCTRGRIEKARAAGIGDDL